jgi:hypothetical protein
MEKEKMREKKACFSFFPFIFLLFNREWKNANKLLPNTDVFFSSSVSSLSSSLSIPSLLRLFNIYLTNK